MRPSRSSPASLRFLGPDVAQEEGQTLVSRPATNRPRRDITPSCSSSKGIAGGTRRVREEHGKGLTHHQRLQELAWLVGDWLDESPDSVVHTTCRWTEDQNFLLRDFTSTSRGSRS